VQVFERSRRQVLPTTAGEEIIRRARRILLEADDLLEAAQRLGDPLAGTLRIGVIPTVSPYLLPDTVPLIGETHPELTIRWVEDKTPVLVAQLARGELDAALLALEADIGALEHAEIARDAFYVAAPPGHVLAGADEPLSLDDLEAHRVLLLDDGHCLRYQTLQLCKHAGVEELGFRATSLPTLVQMVSSGAGITLLPFLAIPTELTRGRMIIRRIAEPPPFRTLALVWRPGSPLEQALRQLTGTMKSAYDQAVARHVETLRAQGVTL
jgi:LysR family hydrogen peroxide-inducible transcriptional activator